MRETTKVQGGMVEIGLHGLPAVTLFEWQYATLSGGAAIGIYLYLCDKYPGAE